MLHKLQPDSMSSCSKAPRGLFVLVRTDGIFTANALSPSPSLRQCPHRYTIRAGQNLPDKEFRYLRTVIVTAAVHRGFSSVREHISLTFRHRAGVSPYTSTFVLAETCVFGKQSRGLFSCGPVTLSITRLWSGSFERQISLMTLCLQHFSRFAVRSLKLTDLIWISKKKTDK